MPDSIDDSDRFLVPPIPELGTGGEQTLKVGVPPGRFDFGQFVLPRKEWILNGRTTAMPVVVAESGPVYCLRLRPGSEEAAALWSGRSVTAVATGCAGGRPTVLRLVSRVVDLPPRRRGGPG